MILEKISPADDESPLLMQPSDLSIICLVVKASVNIVCLNQVHEGRGVDFVDLFYENSSLVPGDDRVDHAGGLPSVASVSHKARGTVVSQAGNFLINLVGVLGHNEKRVFLITLVEELNCLGGGKLENDGIQSPVPAKKDPGNDQNTGVGTKDIIPDIRSAFFRKIDGKEIGSSAAGVSNQAETDGKAVDQTAKGTDQKGVVGDRLRGNQVCQQAGEQDDAAGADGELRPDVAETDIYRDDIEQDIDERVWHLHPGEFLKTILNKKRKAAETAGKQASRSDEGLDI